MASVIKYEADVKRSILEHLQIICEKQSVEKDGGEVSFRSASSTTNKLFLNKDAKWEANEVAYQFLLHSCLPVWMGLLIASRFAEERISEILSPFKSETVLSETDSQRLTEETADVHISGVSFSKAVISDLMNFCKSAMLSAELSFLLPSSFSLRKMSFCAIRNQRRKMEDRHVTVPTLDLVFPNQGLEDVSFYAVFDGHVGQECANYAATHLLPILVSSDAFPTETTEAMRQAFFEIDRRLCYKCEKEKIRSGCTAVVALIRDRRLCIAWTGDSQAALSKADQTVTMLTQPHSPDSEDECRRIEKAGGLVLCVQGEMRVNGVLNVSRSLGDAVLKPVISSEPSVIELELSGSEYYLVLGCDGLWDSLELDDFTESVEEFVKTHPVEEAEEISEWLVQKAKENGSSDNITVVFVYLRSPEDLWQSFC